VEGGGASPHIPETHNLFSTIFLTNYHNRLHYLHQQQTSEVTMTFSNKLSFKPDNSKPIFLQFQKWFEIVKQEASEEMFMALVCEAHANFKDQMLEEITEESNSLFSTIFLTN
jgi:hypothetical protein